MFLDCMLSGKGYEAFLEAGGTNLVFKERQVLDHNTRPERYLTGGSILGANPGSTLSTLELCSVTGDDAALR